jgi:hypothetical protein
MAATVDVALDRRGMRGPAGERCTLCHRPLPEATPANVLTCSDECAELVAAADRAFERWALAGGVSPALEGEYWRALRAMVARRKMRDIGAALG